MKSNLDRTIVFRRINIWNEIIIFIAFDFLIFWRLTLVINPLKLLVILNDFGI
ncbi:hypothetical protein Hanom_Chr14g01281441 [Helianthus anomalus]